MACEAEANPERFGRDPAANRDWVEIEGLKHNDIIDLRESTM